MGVVYLGEHTLLGRRAAIKVLLPDVSDDEEVVARFFNEAKAAMLIPHDGIVRIYDLGYHTDGRAYIVMEYLDGETLGERIRRLGRLPIEQACALIRQIADALGAAHAEGVVHRDLKPDNIFIATDAESPDGERIKILDFGIAKLASRKVDPGFHTRIGRLLGTPPYMAPEQWLGAERVDHKTDIYALGCIFFEMLSGRPPFVEAEVSSLMRAHMESQPPAVSSIEENVGAELDDLVGKLLVKDVFKRFTSMAQVVRALDPLLEQGRAVRPARVEICELPVQGVPVRVTFRQVPASPELRPTTPMRAHRRSTGPQTTLGSSAGALAQARARRRRAGWTRAATSAAAALLLIAAGVAFGAVGVGASSGDTSAQSSRAAASPPSRLGQDFRATVEIAPTVTPIRESAGGPVALEIASTPSGAVVQRAADGEALGTTPYRHELGAASGGEVLILKKAGYRAATLVLGGN